MSESAETVLRTKIQEYLANSEASMAKHREFLNRANDSQMHLAFIDALCQDRDRLKARVDQLDAELSQIQLAFASHSVLHHAEIRRAEDLRRALAELVEACDDTPAVKLLTVRNAVSRARDVLERNKR